VNKIDLIYPSNWNFRTNLPSKAQQRNINDRLSDIRSKLVKVCPSLTRDRIIGYSARRRYRLEHLFGAMLSACPEDRAWVLSSRQEIADYWEYVAPDLRNQIRSMVGVQQNGYE
jgi:predicted GTPase